MIHGVVESVVKSGGAIREYVSTRRPFMSRDQ